jgi:hypothetical protein
MGRRRQGISSRRTAPPTPGNRSADAQPKSETEVTPNPPARRRWFLIVGIVAVAAWILFLAVLALGGY